MFETLKQRLNRPLKPELELIGPFIAKVISNKDPQNKLGRLIVMIPELSGTDPVADVYPKYPTGTQDIPITGQHTWVSFQHLDRGLPMWEGSWWPTQKSPPDIDGNPKKHVYQLVDENNEAEWSVIVDREANKTTFRLDKAGCIIEFDGGSKELRLFSDKDKGDSAPIKLNAGLVSLPVARKFDKVSGIDPLTGLPSDGIIVQGTSRVYTSNDKALI